MMNKLLHMHVTALVLKVLEIWKTRTKQPTWEKLVVAEASMAEDLFKAEEAWIKTIQLLSFTDKITSLREGSKAMITMKQLNIFQDE